MTEPIFDVTGRLVAPAQATGDDRPFGPWCTNHDSRQEIMRDTAYKGYLIRQNPLTGAYWIEKGGSFIGWAKDMQEAKQTIDQLA